MSTAQRLILPLLLFALLGTASAEPRIADGLLDLRDWKAESPIVLSGPWDFTWGRADESLRSGLLQVPGNWATLTGDPRGWGVYSLTVELSEALAAGVRDSLGLRMPLVNSACEVRWNGEVLLRAGAFSRDPSLVVQGKAPGVLALPAVPGLNRLEIAVANRDDPIAGLIDAPELGRMGALLAERERLRMLDLFLFGALVVMGLYHLGLFFFRRRDLSPLWFAALCFLLAFRQLAYGGFVLAEFLPWLGYEVQMKVGYFSFAAGSLAFSLFIAGLFAARTPRWFLPVVLAVSGGYSALVLFAPVAVYGRGLDAFMAFVGLAGATILVILARAVLHRDKGSVLFLTGFVLLFGSVLHDMVKTNYFLPTPFLAPAGLLGFVIFQSLSLIRKFTAALEAAEEHSRHVERMNRSLERFIPREILSLLGKDNILEVELGDHSERAMAVLFADIREFTTLSETLTPNENFRFINSYLERMGPVIRRHGGFVDKYYGDGIMALFPEGPGDAFDAALEMRAALGLYNADRARSGYAPLRIGMGIHWGNLMLGTIGENRRMDSTVISDTVNTASRLEEITKKSEHDILVSAEALAGVKPGRSYGTEFVGEELVRGRRKPIRVYALLAGVEAAGT